MTRLLFSAPRAHLRRPSSFSPALRTLHDELMELRRAAFALELSLQTQHGIPKITLRINPKLGPIVHVKSSAWKSIDANEKLHRVLKTSSTRSFIFTVSLWLELKNER